MKNNESTLKTYLSEIDDTALLTRDEENQLLKKIEKSQNKILKDCIGSDFFKLELLNLLKKQDLKAIAKVSKKLDFLSTKKEVTEIRKSLLQLMKYLEAGTYQNRVNSLLVKISLSGTLVHSLVTRVKKKYSKIESYESEVARVLRYFEVNTKRQLDQVIETVQKDLAARNYLVRKLDTSERRMMGVIYEHSENEAALAVMISRGLTPEKFSEIKRLYKSILSSEKDMRAAKDVLIQRNLRLVVSRAKKFSNRGMEFEDLIQEGNIGLIKAINKHDASRGTKVGTYATWWIDQSIRRAISNKSKTVRIPTHIEFLQSQLATHTAVLNKELGRAPTKEELAERADVGVEMLDRLEQVALHKVGIDVEDEARLTVLETLQSDPEANPFNLAYKRMLKEKIRRILRTLPPRTEKIIRLRFGIGEAQEGLTLQEIANSVGLTKMGVRLVQNKGLHKMTKGGIGKDE